MLLSAVPSPQRNQSGTTLSCTGRKMDQRFDQIVSSAYIRKELVAAHECVFRIYKQ